MTSPDARANEDAQAQARGLSSLLSSPRYQSLASVYCPECEAFVTTLSVQGGPVLVKHEMHSARLGRWCRGRWVAIALRSDTGPVVRLIPVGSSPEEQDRVLAEQSARWYRRLVQEIARAVRARRPLDPHGV